MAGVKLSGIEFVNNLAKKMIACTLSYCPLIVTNKLTLKYCEKQTKTIGKMNRTTMSKHNIYIKL